MATPDPVAEFMTSVKSEIAKLMPEKRFDAGSIIVGIGLVFVAAMLYRMSTTKPAFIPLDESPSSTTDAVNTERHAT